MISTCWAFYDLEKSPATYDFLSFLLLADLYRRKVGVHHLHVVIVPGIKQVFRKGDEVAYNFEHMSWRLKNILVPLCWLMPLTQVTVCGDRDEASKILSGEECLFPESYDIDRPEAMYSFSLVLLAFRFFGNTFTGIRSCPEALMFARRFMNEIAGDKPIITLTLREARYEQQRNSDLKSWWEFSKEIERMGYHPLFIRDVDGLGAFGFPQATWNMELRAAVYELSSLNMTVNGGPAIVSYSNLKARTIMFKMITESVGATTSKFFANMGLPVGSQMEFLPSCRIVWKDDSLETLLEEFEVWRKA